MQFYVLNRGGDIEANVTDCTFKVESYHYLKFSLSFIVS